MSTSAIWTEFFRDAFLTKENLEKQRPSAPPRPPGDPPERVPRYTTSGLIALLVFGASVFVFVCLLIYRSDLNSLDPGAPRTDVNFHLARIFYESFGISAFALLIFLSVWSAIYFFLERIRAIHLKVFGLAMFIIALSGLIQAFSTAEAAATSSIPSPGGAVGSLLAPHLVTTLGTPVTALLFSLVAFASLIFATDWFFVPSLQRRIHGDHHVAHAKRLDQQLSEHAGGGLRPMILPTEDDLDDDLVTTEAEIEVETTTAEKEGMRFRPELVGIKTPVPSPDEESPAVLEPLFDAVDEDPAFVELQADFVAEPGPRAEEEESTELVLEEDDTDDEVIEEEEVVYIYEDEDGNEIPSNELNEWDLGDDEEADDDEEDDEEEEEEEDAEYAEDIEYEDDDEEEEEEEEEDVEEDVGSDEADPATTPARRSARSGQQQKLFESAVAIIFEEKRGSVSLLQRRLDIGYPTASRLLDVMEEEGIVGPYRGPNPRELLISEEDWQER